MQRQAQFKVALLRQALELARQPYGVQAHFHFRRRARLVFRRNFQRHGQQHAALVAEVVQIAHGNHMRHGPGDVARLHAGGQRPVQFCGSARIASVAPIRVPAGGVLQPQAEPHLRRRLTRLRRKHALRRKRQQRGAHLLRGDGVRGALRKLRARAARQQQGSKQHQQETEEAHGVCMRGKSGAFWHGAENGLAVGKNGIYPTILHFIASNVCRQPMYTRTFL